MVSINGKEAVLIVSALVGSCNRILKRLGDCTPEEKQRSDKGNWIADRNTLDSLADSAVSTFKERYQARLDLRQQAMPRFRVWDALSFGIPLSLRRMAYNAGTASMQVSMKEGVYGLSTNGHPSRESMQRMILAVEVIRLKGLRATSEERDETEMRLGDAKRAIQALEVFPSNSRLEVESLNTVQVTDAVLLWQEVERMRRMVSLVLAAMQDDTEFPGGEEGGGGNDTSNLLVRSLVLNGRPESSIFRALANKVSLYPMSSPRATKKVLEELVLGQIKPAPLPLSKHDINLVRAAYCRNPDIISILCQAIANVAGERLLLSAVENAGARGMPRTPRPMKILSADERAAAIETAMAQALAARVEREKQIIAPRENGTGMRM